MDEVQILPFMRLVLGTVEIERASRGWAPTLLFHHCPSVLGPCNVTMDGAATGSLFPGKYTECTELIIGPTTTFGRQEQDTSTQTFRSSALPRSSDTCTCMSTADHIQLQKYFKPKMCHVIIALCLSKTDWHSDMFWPTDLFHLKICFDCQSSDPTWVMTRMLGIFLGNPLVQIPRPSFLLPMTCLQTSGQIES